jgi:hypothetical protein
MFVRWQSYKHRHHEVPKWMRAQPEWLYPKDKKKMMSKTVYTGEVYWQAVLVEAVRVNGKPRHRHIAVLGGFQQSWLEDPHQRRLIWKGILEKLLTLGNRVSPDDHQKIVAAIAKKVAGPIPAPAEMLEMDQEYAKRYPMSEAASKPSVWEGK